MLWLGFSRLLSILFFLSFLHSLLLSRRLLPGLIGNTALVAIILGGIAGRMRWHDR